MQPWHPAVEGGSWTCMHATVGQRLRRHRPLITAAVLNTQPCRKQHTPAPSPGRALASVAGSPVSICCYQALELPRIAGLERQNRAAEACLT